MNDAAKLASTGSAPFRFNAGQFLALCEQGMFDDYAKSELIDGEIVVVNAQFRRHALARRRLVRAFEDALAARNDALTVLDECSIALGDGSMPQPDIVLTTEPNGDGPIPIASVRMIVEISDTSITQDLGRKADLYADAGVPEYWVIDLNENRIVLHTSPRGGGTGYGERRAMPYGEVLHAATVAGLTVETAPLA